MKNILLSIVVILGIITSCTKKEHIDLVGTYIPTTIGTFDPTMDIAGHRLYLRRNGTMSVVGTGSIEIGEYYFSAANGRCYWTNNGIDMQITWCFTKQGNVLIRFSDNGKQAVTYERISLQAKSPSKLQETVGWLD